uniref:Uncharacterized protein n=1 Tax=Opuntia streptacantha TaxID=393608 RepID=A0A7C8ZW98_OPUST
MKSCTIGKRLFINHKIRVMWPPQFTLRLILHANKEKVSWNHLLIKCKILGSSQRCSFFNIRRAKHISGNSVDEFMQILIIYSWWIYFLITKEINSGSAPLHSRLGSNNLLNSLSELQKT